MKKTLSNGIAFLAILLFTLFNAHSSFGQSATKTITYDWATKSVVGNKSLPFDERFIFKIVNLDPAIKNLQVQIKEGNGSKCNSAVDTICFNSLPTIDEFSFTQSRLQSVLIKEKLKPNKDYYIGFKVMDRSKLSDQAKKGLAAYLKNNTELTKEIDDSLRNVVTAKLNISDFNKIIYKYVKNYNGSYEVDTLTITSLKKDDLQYQLVQASLDLNSVGKNIFNLVKSIKLQYHLSDTLLAPLKSMIIDEPGNKCCKLKEGFSINTFYRKLDQIKTDLLKKAHLDAKKSAELKNDYEANVRNFKIHFDNRNDKILSWEGAVLINITAEKTYLIIDLGTTTIDQESTTSSPYISQSFGYGFSPRTAKGLFYFSYSIFFRPINMSVPLSNYRGWDYFATRFCANLGFTLEDIETNKSGKISGLGSLFNNKAGLIGIGYRPLPFLKVDFNYMMYYMDDPNPLLNQKRFTASPLIGLSFNLNIIKIFSGQPNTLTSLRNYTNN